MASDEWPEDDWNVGEDNALHQRTAPSVAAGGALSGVVGLGHAKRASTGRHALDRRLSLRGVRVGENGGSAEWVTNGLKTSG